MFVDSHCHLDKLDYQDLHTSVEDVVNKAKAANVDHLPVSYTHLTLPTTMLV